MLEDAVECSDRFRFCFIQHFFEGRIDQGERKVVLLKISFCEFTVFFSHPDDFNITVFCPVQQPVDVRMRKTGNTYTKWFCILAKANHNRCRQQH